MQQNLQVDLFVYKNVSFFQYLFHIFAILPIITYLPCFFTKFKSQNFIGSMNIELAPNCPWDF